MGQTDQPEGHPATVVRQAGREIIVTRSLDHPVQAVFEAWAQADLFRQWWAPKSMGAVISACEIDARTGGGYRITFGEGPEAATFFGKYLEATAPSRLVWTNEEGGDGPVTTVTFEVQGGRTALTLRETYPDDPPADAVAGMQAMSGEQFDQLDALLASQRAGR
jgi:uncharacterized protein YndB with AHSA1/START domain